MRISLLGNKLWKYKKEEMPSVFASRTKFQLLTLLEAILNTSLKRLWTRYFRLQKLRKVLKRFIETIWNLVDHRLARLSTFRLESFMLLVEVLKASFLINVKGTTRLLTSGVSYLIWTNQRIRTVFVIWVNQTYFRLVDLLVTQAATSCWAVLKY